MSDFPVLTKVENEIQKGIVVIRNIRETHSKFHVKHSNFWLLKKQPFPVNIGELSEWFKEAVLKTVVRLVTGPGVRISYSPHC